MPALIAFTAGKSLQNPLCITSLPQTTAAELGGYIRGHWTVENHLHRQLEVTFNEGQSRKRVVARRPMSARSNSAPGGSVYQYDAERT